MISKNLENEVKRAILKLKLKKGSTLYIAENPKILVYKKIQ